MEIHAHIETATRDCDGLYTSDHIEPSAGRDDLDFFIFITGMYANPYAIYNNMKVESHRLADGDIRMTVSETTDEGFRQTGVTFCHDECDLGEYSQRDHTAEAAGY